MDYYFSVPEDVPNYNYLNISCDERVIPPAAEFINKLGAFGATFVSIGTILTVATIALAADASYHIFLQQETKFYKKSIFIILWVYPIASTCSLIALSIPRAQLLSEAITQITLSISMYRLYRVIIEISKKKVTETTTMLLNVGPCCCWPGLPFPSLQLNDANLSWLQIIVFQFPIIQGILYIILLTMYIEDPVFYTSYNVFLQPLCITSILFALYGLNIAVMTMKQVYPEAKLQLKALVTQLVLCFSKLQGFIIKILPATGLFPCNPPITPQLYANFTYNLLMVIEMLLLCYVARYVYKNHDNVNNKPTEESSPRKVTLQESHCEENKTSTVGGINNNSHVQLPIKLVNMTA
ncbi:organic solute transporter subunit alpha [Chelonus insularis]|uniref:organic solute transporter subunit alpha n=1 Tax=Chelonus insularis TaxID=460826 RepID=UPI00158AC4EE|nr:organic solute transporter subunit alpha-like [Chelonus insularis]